MRTSRIAALAGLLPIIVANAAFMLNVSAGLDACFPYLEGCYSVSRGIRSGPGLWLFKVMSLPTAFLMAWCWVRTAAWLDREAPAETPAKSVRWMGLAGSAFFLVYALWLGTDGEIYRWMRRYGVVFYFAFTALAQLMLASKLWGRKREIRGAVPGPWAGRYLAAVVMMWSLGVASAFKRKLVDDPAFLDRVENALEWNFALMMSLVFVALAMVHRAVERKARQRRVNPGDGR